MTYERAKKLKEEGFPQHLRQYPRYYEDNELNMPTVRRQLMVENPAIELSDEYTQNATVYIPTLSELIAACGDEFGTLGRAKNTQGEISWGATMRSKQYESMYWGNSPQEAVANLWLALQKNNSQP